MVLSSGVLSLVLASTVVAGVAEHVAQDQPQQHFGLAASRLPLADEELLLRRRGYASLGLVLLALSVAVYRVVSMAARERPSLKVPLCSRADLEKGLDAVCPASQVSHAPTCAVCLAPIGQSEECRKLLCDHVFHTECIASWWSSSLAASFPCPVCRHSHAKAVIGHLTVDLCCDVSSVDAIE